MANQVNKRARDGLYTDTVRRLQEAQLAASNQISLDELRQPDALSFIWAARARLLQRPTDGDLIDEIDTKLTSIFLQRPAE